MSKLKPLKLQKCMIKSKYLCGRTDRFYCCIVFCCDTLYCRNGASQNSGFLGMVVWFVLAGPIIGCGSFMGLIVNFLELKEKCMWL